MTAPRRRTRTGSTPTRPNASVFTPHRRHRRLLGASTVDPRLVGRGLWCRVRGRESSRRPRRSASGTSRTAFSNTIHLVGVGRKAEPLSGRPACEQPAGFTNGVQGGGWCRPASEIPAFSGLLGRRHGLPRHAAINATNGQLVSTYPDPFTAPTGPGRYMGSTRAA